VNELHSKHASNDSSRAAGVSVNELSMMGRSHELHSRLLQRQSLGLPTTKRL